MLQVAVETVVAPARLVLKLFLRGMHEWHGYHFDSATGVVDSSVVQPKRRH